MRSPPCFRFAPSPNGELHLGHAYSALFTCRAARESGGRFLLRIEDIDFIRCRQAYVDQALDDLTWLGLRWEEPVRRQSEHFDDYRATLARLDGMGLLYPCFATRQEIAEATASRPGWPKDPDGSPLYPGLYKDIDEEARLRLREEGRPHALRLDLDRALARLRPRGIGPITFREQGIGPEGESGLLHARPEQWGDIVLARKDIGVSYHIAVVVDDALQGITHVTRGHDLFHATGIHRVLQLLLGLPEPVYRHHRLIGDETGRKLSKRAGDRGLRSLREAGVTADELRRALGFADVP